MRWSVVFTCHVRDVGHVHPLRERCTPLHELLAHAAVEPVGVVDRVGVLPLTKVVVGEQDGVLNCPSRSGIAGRTSMWNGSPG